jgi:adenylate kinase
MTKGILVPHHYLSELFLRFFETEASGKGLITDGFPRSMDQWHMIDRVDEKIGASILGVFVTLSEEVAIERIKKRVVVRDGVEVKRGDDTPEGLKERFAVYKHETIPVIDHIRSHHRLVEADGSGTVEQVSQSIFAQLDPILK